MTLPNRKALKDLLYSHVKDPYQRHHAEMVAAAMEGYAKQFGEEEDLWYAAGYLHDLDYDEYPQQHPGKSLAWFQQWGYPEEFIHAVEAHAYGYNNYKTEPQTKMAAALIACDEICGIFYAYSKVNPVPYGDMKPKSINKRIKERSFAPKISRDDIQYGCDKLGIELPQHVVNLVGFLSDVRSLS